MLLLLTCFSTMQDLSYVDFSYACLKNVFFSRANLQCAKFRVGFVRILLIEYLCGRN